MNYNLKSSYIILGAAVLLSACSQTEDVPGGFDVENRQIIFRTALPGVTSRANITTQKSLEYFYVTAFDPVNPECRNKRLEHFFDKKINEVNGEGQYVSSECIWPDPGLESDMLTFFAYSPKINVNFEPKNNSTISGNTPTFDFKLQDFRVENDIDKQVDFVTAYATGSMANNIFSGINLNFAHQLARVEVKAWSAHKSCNIEIAGVRIGEIYMTGTFHFKTDNTTGEWSGITDSDKEKVEYIFRKGDKIVALNKGSNSTSTAAGAVSIMGNKRPDGNDNCAMLLPSNYTGWDLTGGDINNIQKNMYISVLLRIIDATPYAGVQPKERQRYPYRDLVQGTDALKGGISRVYFAVNKADNTIWCQLFKKNETDYNPQDTKYYTADGLPYTVPANQEVKEFGWAAVPVTADWKLGNIYTYTLDYSHGVGVHDPEVTTKAPKAGDPIISDIVGMNVTVVEWKEPTNLGFEIPGH